MKKAISLITALIMVFAVAASPVYAENETTERSFTTVKAQAHDEVFSGLTGDAVIEVDYDFENADFSELTNFNIPFVFKTAEGTEAARFSILGDTVSGAAAAKYLRTSFTHTDSTGTMKSTGELSLRSGFVEKKGKFTFLFSVTDKKLYVKYNGSSLKTDAFMGYCNFNYVKSGDTWTQIETDGFSKLTVGASGCPSLNATVKVYAPENAAAYKIPYTKYTYDTDMTGAISGLFQASAVEAPLDVKKSDTSDVTIEKDAAANNGYIKIPAGKQYSLMFVPQYQGIEGYTAYTYIKYKQYIAADNPVFTGTNTTSVGPYANMESALAITGTNSLKFVGQTVNVPEMTGKWTEIMRVFNPAKKTVTLYVDGKKYITANYNTAGLNYMVFKFDTDMYIDDLEMGEYTPTAADNTFEESYTVPSGQTIDKDLSDYSFGDKMIVDINYDFSASTTANNLNIPIILRNGTTEIARYSIQDSTAAANSNYFQTNFNENNDGLKTLGGLVGRKGNIKILAEFDAQRFSVKYTGEGFKTEQYMGTQSFRAIADKVTTLKVGASGNPGVSLAVKAYPADDSAVTAFKQYKTAYKYDAAATVNNTYLDFKASGSVILENNAVKIPAGQTYSLMLTPQHQGYEGKFIVKYKLKNAGANDFAGSNQVFITNYGGEFGATRTKVTNERNIALASLKNASEVNSDTVYFDTPYAVSKDGWIEFKQIIDLNNHTASLYMDGWFCNTVTLDEAASYINRLTFKFDENDVYIDDVEVATYTDEAVKNTAKLNVERMENGDYSVMASFVEVNAAAEDNAIMAAVTYDENGKLLRIETAPIENNGAKATISGTNAANVKGFLWKQNNIQPLTTVNN